MLSPGPRQRRDEIMDRPDLPAADHGAALRGLARLNRFSGSDRILWPRLRDLARRLPQPLRLLDVACGGGDVLARLGRRAAAADLRFERTGIDRSEFAVASARQADANVRWLVADALADDWPGEFDAVICSLFLHHLDEADAVTLLRRMGAARRLVLVNDLRRSRPGYWLAQVATRLLTRSPVVHFDGPASVAGAWTAEEALKLAGEAGLGGATVEHRWPFRFLLAWERP